MKRKIKVLMSIVMILTMCTMLASCGKESGGSEKKTDAEMIIGDWTCELDMTNMLEESFMSVEGMDDIAQYFEFKNLSFDLEMSFAKDGKCTLKADEDSVEQCFDLLVEQALDGMIKMMEDMAGMSMADLAAASGTTEDALREELKTQLLSEAGLDSSLIADMTLEEETEYEIKDGKIYTAENDYMAYELSGDTLKITEIVEETSSDFSMDEFLPLVFERN